MKPICHEFCETCNNQPCKNNKCYECSYLSRNNECKMRHIKKEPYDIACQFFKKSIVLKTYELFAKK